MSIAPEPAHAHGTAATTAVLLCNLGTPEAPTPAAVRRYLAEFLSDPRVVEIPRLLWWPILHGIILRTRPARSARKYASIWTPEGSPLKVWTEKQALLLERLPRRARPSRSSVRYAMRYGTPSIASVLDAAQGGRRRHTCWCCRSTRSTRPRRRPASATRVAAWMRRVRNLPELRFVKHYHDDPGYIDALAQRVTEHWRVNGRPDQLVLSFHGLPRRSLTLGDPYHCECLEDRRACSPSG